MKTLSWKYATVGLALIVIAPGVIGAPGTHQLSPNDYMMLGICRDVVRLFRGHSDEIWPGYSLAESPFIVYIPERWALLLNGGAEAGGFSALPAGWPAMGTDALYHEGPFRDFVGQLVFDVPVGDTTAVAIGLPDTVPASIEDPEATIFAYIVHEAFHQYQHGAFGEIPWAREEKYPIEDVDNAALAYLEMQLLSDAIREAAEGDRERCRQSAGQFAAVRHLRWAGGDPFVESYEQGMELLEGTAKYVELRCLDLAPAVYRGGASAADRMLEEFDGRMGPGHVPVEDMPRNRIYPVGAAQGFLLDHFGIDWKPAARRAGPDFTFVRLLEEGLGIDESGFPALAETAKARFGFEEILASTRKAIEEYTEGYAEQLRLFEDQPGIRIEFEAGSNGVTRSRVSRAKKWTVDSGSRCLRDRYEVYTLRSGQWSLDVHDAGLLEMEDWDARRRTVVFYAPEVTSISVDGEPVPLDGKISRPFRSLSIEGTDFRLDSSRAGTLSRSGDTYRIVLPPGQ